jgi:LPXTG-motif cell wall-anchored protein
MDGIMRYGIYDYGEGGNQWPVRGEGIPIEDYGDLVLATCEEPGAVIIGGTLAAESWMEIVWPWLALGAVIIAGGAAILLRRRRAHS